MGFVMLDFGGGGVLQNCQFLKCNFLPENNAASSFLIRKRKSNINDTTHPTLTINHSVEVSMEKISTLFSTYQKPPPLWRLRPSRVLALQTCPQADLAHPSFQLFLPGMGMFGGIFKTNPQ